MKRFTALLVSVLLLGSLSACATTQSGAGKTVKCPACGYEFTVPESP